MPHKILITGAFNDARYRLGFFEHIAKAMERMGKQVLRFNAFAFNAPNRGAAKALERCFTVPARLAGVRKASVRAALPWTNEYRREHSLLSAVRTFGPDMLIVITGFRHRPSTIAACRKLGVRHLVGWYVEGPTEPGTPEAESMLYDRYHCIHSEIAPAFQDRIGVLPSYGLDSDTFYRLDIPRSPSPKIVFVGTPTERRLSYLTALKGLPFELWGPGWSSFPELRPMHKSEFIWGSALNELYNRSAIVLNLSSWEANRTGMTQRIVEIPSSGAFMLTDDAPEVKQIFRPGDEIATFTTPADLRRMCQHYLTHADEREAIAARGYQRARTLPGFDNIARILLGCA